MDYIRIILIFLIILLVLPSCEYEDGEQGYTGILADKDVVSSIRQELADRENSLLAEDGDVFWTPSGKLWHSTYECSYLANSKTVYHGSVEQALLDGKEKECSRCFGDENDGIYDSLEGKEIEADDVFFTKEDAVWHYDINCPHLINAEKIYNANEETANELGKLSACSECAD